MHSLFGSRIARATTSCGSSIRCSLRSSHVPLSCSSATISSPLSMHLAKRGLSFIRRTSLSLSRTLQQQQGKARSYNSASLIDPSERFVILSIIGANTLVFCCWKTASDTSLNINYGSKLFCKYLGKFMTNNFMISSNGVLKDYKIHTLFTSFFSHMDAGHFAMNMFTLYFFGMNAVGYLGVSRFAMLYFGGGLFSSLAFVAWPYIGPSIMGRGSIGSRHAKNIEGLGASGAISALIGWSVLTNPTALIYLWAVLPVPAALFGAYYVGSGLWNLYHYNSAAEVSHLGGAMFGLGYYLKMRLGSGGRF